MRSVVQEIHGRSMWQVAGLYVAFTWLVLQVVQTLAEGLGFPDWVVPFALILLAIGFPIVLATAFIQKGPLPKVPRLVTLAEHHPAQAVSCRGPRTRRGARVRGRESPRSGGIPRRIRDAVGGRRCRPPTQGDGSTGQTTGDY